MGNSIFDLTRLHVHVYPKSFIFMPYLLICVKGKSRSLVPCNIFHTNMYIYIYIDKVYSELASNQY